MAATALWRRALGELVGTTLLVAVVVGSGMMATELTDDPALRLLTNSLATAFGLAALILMIGPVSGAHFNPVVSLTDWWLGRRRRRGLTPVDLGVYAGAQIAGAVIGAMLANAMFDYPVLALSGTDRAQVNLWLGEMVATAGLVVLIFALARSGRAGVAPAAVGAYIGAAFWFTSSTSFANPAVTVGRAFTDSFAGISPEDVPGFVIAQLIGMGVGLLLLRALYPRVGEAADDVVIPHDRLTPEA